MAKHWTRYDDTFKVAVVALVVEQKLPISLPTKKLVATWSGSTLLSNMVRFVFAKNAAAFGGFQIETGYLLK